MNCYSTLNCDDELLDDELGGKPPDKELLLDELDEELKLEELEDIAAILPRSF
jgi:hypothetical protein